MLESKDHQEISGFGGVFDLTFASGFGAGWLANVKSTPPAHDFVRPALPFTGSPSHICLKLARSTRWRRRRSALRNLNAAGKNPMKMLFPRLFGRSRQAEGST